MTVSHDERALARQLAQVRKVRRTEAKQARPKNLKADRGRERDTAHLAYIRRQPCEVRHKGGCSGPVQAAHIRYRDARYPNSAGGQVKNHDRHCNPLCAEHHRIQGDVMAERPFWAWAGLDPYETAARHYAAYQGAG